MKRTIDLTNYENFYKTPDELKELRKELYKLALEADWNAWTDTDNDEQREEYLDFVDVEQDEHSIDCDDDDELSELDKKLFGSHSLKPNLTIDELMYFIEKTSNEKYRFWTFAKWDSKRKKFLEYPKFHSYSESMRKYYFEDWANAAEFEIPSDDEE